MRKVDAKIAIMLVVARSFQTDVHTLKDPNMLTVYAKIVILVNTIVTDAHKEGSKLRSKNLMEFKKLKSKAEEARQLLK